MLYVEHKRAVKVKVAGEQVEIQVESPKAESLAEAITFCGGDDDALKYLNRCFSRDSTNNGRNSGNSQPDGTPVEKVVEAVQKGTRDWSPRIRSGISQKAKAELFGSMLEDLKKKADSGAAMSAEDIQAFIESQLASIS